MLCMPIGRIWSVGITSISSSTAVVTTIGIEEARLLLTNTPSVLFHVALTIVSPCSNRLNKPALSLVGQAGFVDDSPTPQVTRNGWWPRSAKRVFATIRASNPASRRIRAFTPPRRSRSSRLRGGRRAARTVPSAGRGILRSTTKPVLAPHRHTPGHKLRSPAPESTSHLPRAPRP